MMPYLVLHYEDPTKLCIAAAENIAEVSLTSIQFLGEILKVYNFQACAVEFERLMSQQQQQQKTETHPLEALGTVMRLYSKHAFSKDCVQWLKCVVKYLSDTYPTTVSQLLVVLTEVRICIL
jgi:hypothetical protein